MEENVQRRYDDVRKRTSGPKHIEKPPLGLRPRFIADQERAIEIIEALKRYAEAGQSPPLAWIEELQERMCDCDLAKIGQVGKQTGFI